MMKSTFIDILKEKNIFKKNPYNRRDLSYIQKEEPIIGELPTELFGIFPFICNKI